MDHTSIRQGQPAPRVRRPRDGEESIEVRRYLGAVRRAWVPITPFIVLATAVAVLASLSLPKTYTAQSSIVKQVTAGPTIRSTSSRCSASCRRSSGSCSPRTWPTRPRGDCPARTHRRCAGRQLERGPRGEPAVPHRHRADGRDRRAARERRRRGVRRRAAPDRPAALRAGARGAARRARAGAQRPVRRREPGDGVAPAAVGAQRRAGQRRRRPPGRRARDDTGLADLAAPAAQRRHRVLPRAVHRRAGGARPRPAGAAACPGRAS